MNREVKLQLMHLPRGIKMMEQCLSEWQGTARAEGDDDSIILSKLGKSLSEKEIWVIQCTWATSCWGSSSHSTGRAERLNATTFPAVELRRSQSL